jgi:RNase adapter protein RapZ
MRRSLPHRKGGRSHAVRFVIVTGISGSGKSLALRLFEDLGYYCVDNVPPALIPQLAALCDEHVDRVACVTDVRAGRYIEGLDPALAALRERGVYTQILFLDASDATLVNRFKETRRKHPLLAATGGILGSIAAEREILKGLKEQADKIIDTTDYTPRSLASAINDYFGANGRPESLIISLCSFGFKYGLPLEADLVFDVRFLANPHYVRELRWQDGRDEAVVNYVRQDTRTQPFLDKMLDLVGFTIPQYIAEGKAYLTIAIGCTGGRHRSVFVVEELAKFLQGQDYHPLIHHRDVKK